MIKRGKSFVPSDFMAEDALDKVKDGAHVRVTFSVPRSLPQHNLFFAIIHRAWKFQVEPKIYRTAEDLRAAILVALGHYIEVTWLDGKIERRPKSMDFASMEQTEFKNLFDEAMDLIAKHIVPNARPEFEQEFYNMLREPGPDALRG